MATMRRSLSMVCAAATVLSLGACAVRSEPVLTSSEAPVAQLQEVALVLEENATSTRSLFRAALASELSSRNVALIDSAPFVGDYSISASNAEVPIYTSEAGQAEVDPVAIVVERERNWTDSCDAVRTRATLAIYRVTDGSLVNRSVAEAMICEGDVTPYQGLADALVDGVIGN